MKAFAFAVVTLASLTTLAFADDTAIHAEYTANYDRLRPTPYKDIHLKNSIDLVLTDNNEVREEYKKETGKFTDTRSRSNKLGASWTVMEGNRLQKIVDRPQSTTEMTITVDGKTCKFDIQFKLKPGFSEFAFIKLTDGKIGYFTEPMVQTTTCTIQ